MVLTILFASWGKSTQWAFQAQGDCSFSLAFLATALTLFPSAPLSSLLSLMSTLTEADLVLYEQKDPSDLQTKDCPRLGIALAPSTSCHPGW